MEEPPIPQVSVLIVSWNCAPALRRCLRALELSNERDKFEIVLVDSGSQDESPSLDVEFPSVTLLRLPRNFGFTKALNIGMRTAKADLFFFLDPRVEVQPDTIPRLAARLAAEPDVLAACPLLVGPDGAPQPEVYKLPVSDIAAVARAGAFPIAAPPDLSRESVPVEFPSFAALMVRSYFLKGLRYIDQRYGQTWADAELAAQMRRSSKKALLLPDVRAVRRPDEDDILASAPPQARALLAADWALGASAYAGKYFGFWAGLKVRLAAVLRALGSLLRFRDLGYHRARLGFLVSGQKVDGTQRVL